MHAIGVGGERVPGDLAVALDVVAGHDRRRCDAAVAPPRQRLGHQAEHVDALTEVVDVVAALGDRQRDDPGARRGQQFDHRLGIVGRVAVVDDRADHPGVAGAVGVLEQQGVQAVLRGHHVGHLAVGGHDADPADAPVFGEAHLQEAVDVHRLVRAVEAADAEMHYADADLVAVVARLVDR